MDYLHEQGVDEILVYRLLGLPGSPMMRDVDTYGLVFSSMPPYELLRSQSFSLDDILFCEAFSNTYYGLRGHLGEDMLRRFARMAGSLSALVRLVMETGALQRDSVEELNRVLASVMRAETTEGKLLQNAVP